jgi:ParB family transcriptional regulator, chromosome partitioning protein
MTRGKRQRLGRGLGALLGSDYMAPSPGDSDVRTVSMAAIVPNPLQPRREFRTEELEELVASIRENGLLQPLVVRPDPDGNGERFQLVAGERRFRALARLRWDEVPAVVREVDDRTLLVLALVENLQREALGPLEEAEGFQALSDDFGLTQEEIAHAVGKNRSTVANAIRLLRLPHSIRRLLEEGSLTMGHARALLAVDDPGRMVELGRRAAREGWSVRETEARTRKGGEEERSEGRKGTGKAVHDPVVTALQESLREALGTRVQLRPGTRGAGSVEIPFRDEEDFERIFQLLTGKEVGEVSG